jgi:hypothetical protein
LRENEVRFLIISHKSPAFGALVNFFEKISPVHGYLNHCARFLCHRQ